MSTENKSLFEIFDLMSLILDKLKPAARVQTDICDDLFTKSQAQIEPYRDLLYMVSDDIWEVYNMIEDAYTSIDNIRHRIMEVGL